MKQVFRLIPVRVPYWRRYAASLPQLRMICLAQRGCELWTVRTDGTRVWMIQGRLWFVLDEGSAARLSSVERVVWRGQCPELPLEYERCQPLPGASAARADAGEAGRPHLAPPAARRDVWPMMSSWTPPAGAADRVPVSVQVRRRRLFAASSGPAEDGAGQPAPSSALQDRQGGDGPKAKAA